MDISRDTEALKRAQLKAARQDILATRIPLGLLAAAGAAALLGLPLAPEPLLAGAAIIVALCRVGD